MPRLEGPRFGPVAGGAPRQLVVLLHGVGADGADLIGLAPRWAETLPHAAFLAPDAPMPCDMAGFGRQWFSLADRDPERLAQGVRGVAPVVEALLRAELGRLGLPASALALMGFSQGAMTALHVGLRGGVSPAVILAYSGALLAPQRLAAEIRARPPVLLVHGEADEVVPAWAGRFAESALREAGVPVESLFLPGLGHGVDEAGLAAGARMLRRAFAPAP
ncbi:alpha/beta hydrolase [Crenalkalicoccus roseus]|uniref:alpha/beta hydrolase n=1 Tax=Crenalkalicoccus roseus TaxID=1485588 RepID=UPI001081C7E8|nr:prolyl oligopeptidase family serine peptidase [Crenalkalicoccus roseus]